MKSKYCKKGENMRKFVWPNSQNSYSEIFRKKAILKLLGKHAWQIPLLSSFTAYSLELYWRKTSSNIFSWDLLEITHNFYPTSGATTISCLLSYHVYCAVIPHQYKQCLAWCDTYHCQHTLINQYISIWSSQYCISFSFLVGSFFQPQNTLNLNYGLSYIGNLHLLEPLPVSESKDQE